MNYCHKCGQWRWISLWYMCKECGEAFIDDTTAAEPYWDEADEPG